MLMHLKSLIRRRIIHKKIQATRILKTCRVTPERTETPKGVINDIAVELVFFKSRFVIFPTDISQHIVNLGLCHSFY